MKIMPNRMDRGFYQYQKEFEDKALEVLRSGWYVLGKRSVFIRRRVCFICRNKILCWFKAIHTLQL